MGNYVETNPEKKSSQIGQETWLKRLRQANSTAHKSVVANQGNKEGD